MCGGGGVGGVWVTPEYSAAYDLTPYDLTTPRLTLPGAGPGAALPPSRLSHLGSMRQPNFASEPEPSSPTPEYGACASASLCLALLCLAPSLFALPCLRSRRPAARHGGGADCMRNMARWMRPGFESLPRLTVTHMPVET